MKYAGNYTAVLRKLKFYREWLCDLTREELDGFIGRWVLDRVILLSDAAKKIESAIGHRTFGGGNYTSRIVEGL